MNVKDITYEQDSNQDIQSLHNNIWPNIKIRILNNESFFGPGVADLLTYIKQTGSTHSACESMGMSYSKGRKILKKIEIEYGCPAVECIQGGINGGNSTLTDAGEELLEHFLECQKDVDQYSRSVFNKYFSIK